METTISKEAIWEQRLQSLYSLIGHTALLPVYSRNHKRADVFAKAEWMQPGGSVKARAAINIVRRAVADQSLKPGKTLLDASSGNTAIAYAMVAARAGINCRICIPEHASQERIDTLRALGVHLTFTPAEELTGGASEMAKKLSEEYPEKYFYADQYNNSANSEAHEMTTAAEIIDQTGGKVTHFVAGLGTTGTITGVARGLRKFNPAIKIIGLQPDNAMHALEGWKHLETEDTPGIFDRKLIDEIKPVSSDEAIAFIPEAAGTEGLLLSPSSAANMLGALEVAREVRYGKVVTILPDDAAKYSHIISQLF